MYIIISNIHIILVVIIKAGCNVAQYIYSSPASAVWGRFPFLCYFTLTFHFISEGNIVLLLHYIYQTALVTGYFSYQYLHVKHMIRLENGHFYK